MSGHDEVRKNVSDTYAKAIAEPATEGCGCCGGGPTPKGAAAKLAGYTAKELEALPAEAVVNSFGCGNPLAFSGVREGDVVLDLGSGAGMDVLLAAKKVGPTGRSIGIDMTDEMIAKARENIAASGMANAEVRRGLIENLPVEDASVDWVISNCVINLSPEKERVFAEIARVLRPGGQMLVSDIVVEEMPSWLRGIRELYASCISGAVSQAEYLSGLVEAGLEAVEVRERVEYDTSQMKEIILTETIPGADEARTALTPLATDRIVNRAAKDLQGRVASIQVYARKPRA